MQLHYEQTNHNNLQRLLYQIKDNIHQSLRALEEMNSQTQSSTPNPLEQQRKLDLKRGIDAKMDMVCQKLNEYKLNHWKINEETQINSIVWSLRNNVKGQIGFPQFQEMVIHEAKEEVFYLKELTQRRKFQAEYKYEIYEMTTFNSKEPEVQIAIYRPQDLEERFWYLATFITTQTNSQTHQTFDIQLNPIDSKKETNTIQKIKVDPEYIIYQKLNAWFRHLYFARVNQKSLGTEDLNSFGGFLNYIKETMNRLFGPQSANERENGCHKCGNVFKLSSIKKEGLILPYIYFIEYKQNHDQNDPNLQIDHQMFHEQCFFNVQT